MKETNNGNIPFFVSLAVVFICLVLGVTYMVQNSEADRGTFGDMFGFANAVFTGLSIVGLLYTILLQRKDINIQRDELSKQNEVTYIQNFESTFFQMIALYNNFLENLTRGVTKGRTILRAISERITGDMRDHVVLNGKIDLEVCRRLFSRTYNLYGSEMEHHMRIIISIIELIDTTQRIDKMKYVRILKANLSLDDLTLIYYGIIYKENFRIKNLIEKYPVFEDIENQNIDPSIAQYYSSNVYRKD